MTNNKKWMGFGAFVLVAALALMWTQKVGVFRSGSLSGDVSGLTKIAGSPVFTAVPIPPTVTNNQENKLYVFTVAAPASNSVGLGRMVFDVSQKGFSLLDSVSISRDGIALVPGDATKANEVYLRWDTNKSTTVPSTASPDTPVAPPNTPPPTCFADVVLSGAVGTGMNCAGGMSASSKLIVSFPKEEIIPAGTTRTYALSARIVSETAASDHSLTVGFAGTLPVVTTETTSLTLKAPVEPIPGSAPGDLEAYSAYSIDPIPLSATGIQDFPVKNDRVRIVAVLDVKRDFGWMALWPVWFNDISIPTNMTSSQSIGPLSTAVEIIFATPFIFDTDPVKASHTVSIMRSLPDVIAFAEALKANADKADPLSEPAVEEALKSAMSATINALNKSGPSATCNNGVVETGEFCDDIHCNAMCAACGAGYAKGANGLCEKIVAVCGNGKVEDPEFCDGANCNAACNGCVSNLFGKDVTTGKCVQIHKGLPHDVTSVTATPGDAGAVKVSWDKATDFDGKDVKHYRVYYGKTSIQASTNGLYEKQLDTTDASTSYTLVGLDPSTLYYLSVTAVNGEGVESEAYSTEITSLSGGAPVSHAIFSPLATSLFENHTDLVNKANTTEPRTVIWSLDPASTTHRKARIEAGADPIISYSSCSSGCTSDDFYDQSTLMSPLPKAHTAKLKQTPSEAALSASAFTDPIVISSRNLVADHTGKDENYLVSGYQFKASGDAWTVDKLTIMNDAEGAFDTPVNTPAIVAVKISYPDKDGKTQTKTGAMFSGKATFTNLDFFIGKDKQATLEISVDVSGPSEIGAVFSGQTFRLGIQDTANDQNTFDARNASNSVDLITPVITNGDKVNSMVVRGSVPTIARVGSTPSLTNGENTLYQFTVTPDAAGAVNLGRMVFDITESGLTTIDQVKLFRGADLLTSGTAYSGGDAYLIWDQGGSDQCFADALTDTATSTPFPTGFECKGGTLPAPTVRRVTTGKLIVVFPQGQPISAGTPQSFTIKATVSGANPKDWITVNFATGDETSKVTGKIFSSGNDGLFSNNLDYFLNSTTVTDRNFIWSDQSSDKPAYPTVIWGDAVMGTGPTMGTDGSADWTNGYLLNLDKLPENRMEM